MWTHNCFVQTNLITGMPKKETHEVVLFEIWMLHVSLFLIRFVFFFCSSVHWKWAESRVLSLLPFRQWTYSVGFMPTVTVVVVDSCKKWRLFWFFVLFCSKEIASESKDRWNLCNGWFGAKRFNPVLTKYFDLNMNKATKKTTTTKSRWR